MISTRTTLYREFDACGECRLEVGGPEKYRFLSEDEVRDVLNAFECRDKLTKMTWWLEANQPDVFKRGLWDAMTPNVRSQATDAALSRQVACTDGLGVAVPSAPTFGDKA